MSVFNYHQLDKPNSNYPFEESDGSESVDSYSIVPSSSDDPSSLKLRLKRNNDEQPASNFVYAESDSENEMMDASITTNDVVASTSESVASDDVPTTSGASSSKRGRKIPAEEFVQLEHEFLCGDKSNSKVLSTMCDRHLYTKNGSCVHGIRYRCRDRTCRAFVIYDKVTKTCFRLPSAPPHKHIKNTVEADYWNLIAKNEMRALCADLATLASGKQIASVDSIFTTVKNK